MDQGWGSPLVKALMFLRLWLDISDQHMYNWKDTAKSSLFVLSYDRKENLALKELFVGIFQFNLVIFYFLLGHILCLSSRLSVLNYP